MTASADAATIVAAAAEMSTSVELTVDAAPAVRHLQQHAVKLLGAQAAAAA